MPRPNPRQARDTPYRVENKLDVCWHAAKASIALSQEPTLPSVPSSTTCNGSCGHCPSSIWKNPPATMILTSEKLYTRYKNPADEIDKNLSVNYLEPDPRYALRVPEIRPEPFPSPSPAMYDLGLSLVLPPPPPTPGDELEEKDTRLMQTVAAIPSSETAAGGLGEERTNGLARTSTIIFHPQPSDDTDEEAPLLTRTITAIYDPDGAPCESKGPSDVALTGSDTVLHKRKPSSSDTVPTRDQAETDCPLPSTSDCATRRPQSAAGIRSPEHTPPPMRPTTSYTESPSPWTMKVEDSPPRRRSSPRIEEVSPRWEWPLVESGASSPSERSPWLDFLIPALTYNTPSCIAGDLAVPYQCVKRDAELRDFGMLEVGIWGEQSHRGVGV
ncbi:hypothetical protein K491DRAFT_699525 [Lophiostoma macrostomum CBS 122681]|uniref:Uncharacterized protein n=1 Tax=Lophiostoma macrostomum CBS 122681 TaxID=1314788 RepID=A0A6A6SKT3_9PLEO|nr:hypothetical protein K491DRAFT_699525 [Lophiostoma macrostomum CBS 122681]